MKLLTLIIPAVLYGLQMTNLVSIYDGDTFTANLNCSEELLCSKMPIRVKGVDTPEIKGKSEAEKNLAKKAKEYTKSFLSRPNIVLQDCTRDKYFRLDCYVMVGDSNLTKELIDKRLGVPYMGETKVTDWATFK